MNAEPGGLAPAARVATATGPAQLVPQPATVPTGRSATSRRGRLGRFVLLRLGRLVLVLFGVLTLLFLVLRVSGNPAQVLAGPQASPATVAATAKALGLDRPLLSQYVTFLSQAVRMNFGVSYATKGDAFSLVISHLPESLGLIGLAMVVAIAVGVPLGILGAITRARPFERFLDLVVLLGQAVPIFWLAVILIWLLSVQHQVLPSLAPNGFSSNVTSWVQPVLVLALFPMARVLQMTRSGLTESMSEDFTRTATAKGLSRSQVVVRHGMRPVLLTLVTVIGLDLSAMLSGAVLVEVIYSWPGIGQLLVSSVSGRDYPVVEVITTLLAILVVFIGFLVDLAYGFLDPRVEAR